MKLPVYSGLLLVASVVICGGQILIKTKVSVDSPTEFWGTAKAVQFNGTSYVVASFRGIQYAVAPVGEKRFAKPEPYVFNTNTYNATQFKNICHQPKTNDTCQRSYTMDEDCLYLNIYSPVPTLTVSDVTNSTANATLPDASNSSRAVLVFIHGGGWYEGNGNCYDASVVSAYGDIVVVTFNYRLGALGFLSTDDGNIMGNLGLFDQREALNWISKYIWLFGGDPSRVTISGQSAGGISALLQGLYPQNDKLFSRIISQSGNPAAPKSVTKSLYSTSLQLAQMLGCNVSGEGRGLEIKACLMKVNASSFSQTVVPLSLPMSLVYEPSVDGDMVAVDTFDLFQSSLKSSSKVLPDSFLNKDLLVGYTADDGEVIYRLRALIRSNEAKNTTMLKEAITSPISMSTLTNIITEFFIDSFNDTIDDLILQAVLDRYVDWGKLSDTYSIGYQTIKLLTDIEFAIPILNIALGSSLARDANSSFTGKTYVYRLNLPITNKYYLNSNLPWFKGTSHSDDIPFLFGNVNDSNSYDISKSVMTYWSNFVKTGNPNLQVWNQTTTNVATNWTVFSTIDKSYLDISSPSVMKQQLASENQHFWGEFLPRLVSRLISSAEESTTTTSPKACPSANSGATLTLTSSFLIIFLVLSFLASP